MFLPFFQQDTVRLWKPVSRGFHPFERHRRGIFTFFAPRVRPAILTCLGLSILANAASWMLFASFTAVGVGIVLFQAVVLSLQLFFFDERKRPPA